MKLTLIKDVSMIQVDGNITHNVSMDNIPENIRAVQWDGVSGEIEYSDGSHNDCIDAMPDWMKEVSVQADLLIKSEIAEKNLQEIKREQYLNSYEGKAEAIRLKRNDLIAETDWWASTDLEMTPEQAEYRKRLRDISKQDDFPYEVQFPVKPA